MVGARQGKSGEFETGRRSFSSSRRNWNAFLVSFLFPSSLLSSSDPPPPTTGGTLPSDPHSCCHPRPFPLFVLLPLESEPSQQGSETHRRHVHPWSHSCTSRARFCPSQRPEIVAPPPTFVENVEESFARPHRRLGACPPAATFQRRHDLPRCQELPPHLRFVAVHCPFLTPQQSPASLRTFRCSIHHLPSTLLTAMRRMASSVAGLPLLPASTAKNGRST